MHRLTTIFLLSLTVPALPVFGQGSTTSCAHSLSADTTVFALDEVTEMPIRQRLEPPRLPPAFFRMKVNVQVMLSFIVNKDGTVDTSSVVVVEPQGSALESEAVRVVKKATFSPACRDHNAVRVRDRVRAVRIPTLLVYAACCGGGLVLLLLIAMGRLAYRGENASVAA